MTLPALSTTWSLDGMSFNTGPNADGASLIITGTKGWSGSPTGQPTTTRRVSGHGAFRGPNYRAARVVDVSGVGQAASRAQRLDLIDQLSGLMLDPHTLYPLVRTDPDRELTLWVELNSELDVTERPDGVSIGFGFQLLAVDPCKYSAARTSPSTSLAVDATGGIRWNGTTAASGGTGTEWNARRAAPTGLVYQTAGGTAGTLTLTNEGTAWAPIDFTITVLPGGVAINPTMLDNSTGRRITFGETVHAGSVVRINTTGVTTLDGVDRGGSLTSAQFFMVPPRGTITVTFLADPGSSGALLSATNADVYL